MLPRQGAVRDRVSFRQKTYFNANCMILASAEVVICPKVLLFRVVFGAVFASKPGLKLFVRLKTSARNSTF